MRRIRRLSALVIACAVIAPVPPLAAQARHALPDSVVAAIDRAFAPMAHSGSPGCSVGVFQDGAVTFARGYGFADLINDVPITPATRFTVGSVSKQFTAATIALLVQTGRISLSDDVRKYIPELHEYPTPVTIGHLVHHTSGVRDFWELVDLAGMRPDDGYTPDDMLNLAQHQKGLNFTPGAEYRYSNTGYLLLGIVVKRVTGQSLRQFADSAIFKPLGMRNSLYLDDHNEIVPRRASAYSPTRDGFRINVWNNDIVGQGGVVTTIGDLQKWDENFYDARVGGPAFVSLMQTTEKLNDGRPNGYAFGLTVENYRGMRVVQHTGATGGYRAAIYRFPDAHTSMAMLCNVTSANTTALSLAMADAVLGSRLGARDASPRGGGRGTAAAQPHAAPPEVLSAVAGRYRSDELLGSVWEVTATGSGAISVHRPRGDPENFEWVSDFGFAARRVSLSFAKPVRGKSPGFEVKGDRVEGLRFERLP